MNLRNSKHKLIGVAAVSLTGMLIIPLAFAAHSSSGLGRLGKERATNFTPALLDHTSNGPTQKGEICMQKVFGTPVAGSTRLNCTANDVRIARAISVEPSTCEQGDIIDLKAEFEVVVTADERYDTGYFFRTDGGPNARGDGSDATGECSLSAVDPTIEPGLDLDGDSCGDLESGTHNLFFEIPGVLCDDSDNDGFLNLPNCTSWHSNQGTACNINDAFTFDPETKSKCKCDDEFEVPVTVTSPTGKLVKTVKEVKVTYGVEVTNDSAFDVDVNSLDDTEYGEICDALNTDIDSTTCACGVTIGAGDTLECDFTVSHPDPTTFNVVNLFSAELERSDDLGTPTTVSDDAQIMCVITNDPVTP